VTTVVAGVIERGDRILIAQRRADGAHPLKWEFPGGKVEGGESPEAALTRELQEELAIQAAVHDEITRYEFRYPGAAAPILLIFYRVLEFTGEPINLNFERIEWAPKSRLKDFDFLEGDADFLTLFAG
jgi:8-oxo-dGTP diphosphatase